MLIRSDLQCRSQLTPRNGQKLPAECGRFAHLAPTPALSKLTPHPIGTIHCACQIVQHTMHWQLNRRLLPSNCDYGRTMAVAVSEL